MRKLLIITVLAIAALGLGIGAQLVRGGSAEPTAAHDPPGAAEAPALQRDDVPVRLAAATKVFTSDEDEAFRARWTRLSANSAVNYTPAPTSRIEAHMRTQLGGGVWSVTTYHNVDGEPCFGERFPVGGQGITCAPREEFFQDGPLSVWSGRRQASDPTQWNVFWIYGLAKRPVASVEVVATDCSRTTVPLDEDGVFLHLVGPARIYDGVWPYRLIGRDVAGEVVAEKRLPLNAPETDAARQAGVEPPRPRGCP